MAKYEVISFEIRTSSKPKLHDYLYLRLRNLDCVWEKPITSVHHEERLVKMFRRYTIKTLPDECRYVHAERVIYTPGIPFNVIRKGETLTDHNDNAVIFTSLEVMCMYYYDENNNKQYCGGHSPSARGARSFAYFCKPVPKEQLFSEREVCFEVGNTKLKCTVTDRELQKIGKLLSEYSEQSVTAYSIVEEFPKPSTDCIPALTSL